MFGPVGGPEFLLLLVLALLLFGPRKLPQIGKSLGRAMAEFRGATNEFRSTLEREVEMERVQEDRATLKSVGREIQDAVTDVTRPWDKRAADAPRETDAKAQGDGEAHGDSGREPTKQT